MAQVPAKQAAEEAMVRTEAAGTSGREMTIEEFAAALRRSGLFDVVKVGPHQVTNIIEKEQVGEIEPGIPIFRVVERPETINAVVVWWDGMERCLFIPWPAPPHVLELLDEYRPGWRKEISNTEAARAR